MDTLHILESELQAAIFAAWDGVLERSREIGGTSAPFARADAAIAITEIVNGTIAELLQRPSGQPFSLLAVETIAEILGWLSVKDRVVASSTCKNWYNAAYSTPHIWTEITYSSTLFQTPVALTKMLEYSAECPIFLEVTIEDDNWVTVCSELLASMDRITRLDLNVAYDFDLQGQSELKRALSQPAPLLRMFWLEDPYNNLYGLGQEGTELFGNHAPCLRDAVLRCNVNRIEPEYNTVFQHTRRVLIHQVGEWSVGNIVHAVKLFPNMKQFIARIDTWGEDEPSGHLVELPESLEAFEAFATYTFDTPGHIIDHVRWRGVPRVITELSTDHATEDAIHNFFRATSQTALQDERVTDGLSVAPTLWIDWDVNSPSHQFSSVAVHMFEFETDELRALIPLSHPLKVNSRLVRERALLFVSTPLPASLGESITSLFLNELAFDPAMFPHPLPPFPSLEHLTIWTIPSAFHAAEYGTSPFVARLELEDEPEETRRLACPALQRLTIAAGHGEWSVDGPRPRFSPDQVTEFIKTHIDYNTERLRKLTFLGIELVLANPADFSDMCALAESLECEKRFLSWTGNASFHWSMMDTW